MEIVNLFFIVIFVFYTLFIGLLIYGFSKVQAFVSLDMKSKTSFSIVVPFRNEEKNLPELLQSFIQLNYPKDLFEIILVDDASNDNAVSIIKEWKTENPSFDLTVVNNVRSSNSPKKDAITSAILMAKYDWIITTDADCSVRENWLSVFNHYIQNHSVEMIAGGVNYSIQKGLLSHFQQMDLLSLQGATIGSFGLNKAFMCNGANFAYSKKTFHDLNGFEGNNAIASGDDVFLLQKVVSKFPEKVHYLKSEEAIVTTKTEESWLSLFYQRVRWASKAGAYDSVFSKGLAVVVFLANLSLVLGLFLILTNVLNWKFLLMLFLVKFVFDFILMYKTNRFLRMCMHSVVVSSLLYPFFSSGVALYSLVGSYKWKERRFKK
ncbi:glycosyltransferase [Flavobacterium sp.]|uniref:glycosyltransferase family 2 protein n=1 Tax=Flavobacterium sp. TaxID=239 RepID=UPI00260252ED|nr:glycosyltransferase [Flavobacterium sp.]